MREQAVFYVYALKDPRTSKPFYVGKGTGIRAWEHEQEEGESAKVRQIADIRKVGLEPITVKLVEDLSEVEALRIEAELISAFGTKERDGLLTNVVIPSGTFLHDKPSVTVPSGIVEKAQISLEHLKDAVFELTLANKDGVTNYEVAKSLGLQSDYGGGSKNYLSYSVLGILMREGKVERLPNKKHIATFREKGKRKVAKTH